MNTSNTKFYVISTIIIIAGLYTVLTTSVYTFASTDFGLVNRLPILYWVGLVSIGILFYTSRDSFNKSAFAFIFLIIFLFVIPAVVRVPGWLSNSYYPYANSLKVNDVKSSINLNQESDISTSYYYWPLFLFLASIVNITTYCNVELMLKFFPILTMIIIGLLSYLIFKMKFNEITSLAGASLVLGSFWLRQQYYGPQAIAYIFFAFVLYVFSYILFKQIKFRNEIFIIFIVFFVSILFTHLLTFGIIVFMLGSIFVLNLVKHIENYKPLFYLTILSGIASAAYYLRGYLIPSSGGISTNYISWIYTTIINSITHINKLAIFKESSRIQATPPQILNYYSSWIIVVLDGICIAYLLMTFIVKKFDPKSILWENFSLFLVLFLACLGVLAVGLTYGPEESYQRAFMFGILPLVFFSLTQLSKHKNLLYLTLFAIIILNVPAQYGSDNFRTATSTLMSGNKFFSDLAKSSTETTAINIDGLYSRYYNPDKHFEFTSIGTLPFTSNTSVLKDQATKLNNTKYLILSKAENNFYTFYLGFDPITTFHINKYKITNYPNSTVTEFYTSRIYDNSGLQIIRLLKTYTVTFFMETRGSTHNDIRMFSSEQILSGTHLSFNVPTALARAYNLTFDHWEVNRNNLGNATTLNITVNNSLFVNAVFHYTLTLTTSTTSGEGSIDETINYPQIELYADRAPGSQFLDWSGDSNSTNQHITILMDSNKNLKANFGNATKLIPPDGFESIKSRSNTTDKGSIFEIISNATRTHPTNKVAKFQTNSNYNSFVIYQLNSTQEEVDARGYFYLEPHAFNSSISSETRLCLLRFTSGDSVLAGAGIISDNIKGIDEWAIFNNTRGIPIPPPPNVETLPLYVVTGRLHSVELHYKTSPTTTFIEMYIDGTLVSTNYPTKNNLGNVTEIDVGITAASAKTNLTLYADDVVISNGYVGTR